MLYRSVTECRVVADLNQGNESLTATTEHVNNIFLLLKFDFS